MRRFIIAIMVWAIFVAWTILCIYGTYNNTIKSASVREVEDGYEITYGNTGEIHLYDKEEAR